MDEETYQKKKNQTCLLLLFSLEALPFGNVGERGNNALLKLPYTHQPSVNSALTAVLAQLCSVASISACSTCVWGAITRVKVRLLPR